MKQEKVSVIVPIYNAEKYLRVCLDSLAGQTYHNLEILLINDGSKDSSGQICDEYVEKCSNMKCFHQSNQGVTKARQKGLEQASGDYIAFVDGDDWVEEDFIEVLVKEMLLHRADVVVQGCVLEKGNHAEIEYNRFTAGIYEGKLLEKEIYPQMLCYETFFRFGIQPYLCNKLFKKEFLLESFREIDAKIYDGEDVAILFPCLLSVKKIIVVNQAKYHYRIHSQSVSVNKKEDFYENVSRLYMYLNRKFKETEYYGIMLPQLDQYMRMMVRSGNPDAFIETERKMFPFGDIPKNAKVVLYGAGHIGKLYFYQIRQSGYCQVVAWLDKNKHGETIYGYKLDKPEDIPQEFDYVVIALADERVIQQVKHDMMARGIDEERIK